ncbi:GAF domain-like protein [Mycotypha africana]|uniref:GAF domain-like protein n=1 Tax=Mycotypha africana TaxID=64632 RepID=UPI002300BC26|nr:GAF domain-like protein [Mycotypha africana]KAI8979798.1 GAF domain-like protein [Mycotypha africana]
MKEIITNADPHRSRKEFYEELLEQIKSICEDQTFWVSFDNRLRVKSSQFNKPVLSAQVTNLSNASAVIYHALRSLEHFQKKPINWCGFYLTDRKNDELLILGPFQGKVACTAIPFGKGVCGAAARTKQSQVIRDVHEFPGHIACDSASNSEVVIPLIKDNRVLGVLDIDCEKIEGFTEEDKEGLEKIAKAIVDSCEWPSN